MINGGHHPFSTKNGIDPTAPVTDLKNRLSHYLRLVARGESVTILDRGRPIAQIVRIETDDAELDALVAARQIGNFSR
jgi:prevent-host-death family protein